MKKSTSTNQGNQDGGIVDEAEHLQSEQRKGRRGSRPPPTEQLRVPPEKMTGTGSRRGGASAGGGVNPSERVASGGERTGDGRVSGGAEGGKRVAVWETQLLARGPQNTGTSSFRIVFTSPMVT